MKMPAVASIVKERSVTIDRDKDLISTACAALLRAARGASPANDRLRLKRSVAIVFGFQGARRVMYNYLTNTLAKLTADLEAIMAQMSRWQPIKALLPTNARRRRVLCANLVKLVKAGFVIVKGGALAKDDSTLIREWPWDIRSGIFHLATKDPPLMEYDESNRYLEQLVKRKRPVDLFLTNQGFSPAIPLNRPMLKSGLFAMFAARRTHRVFSEKSLSLKALSECLFAGLGITGYVIDAVEGYGKLPLKLTPSGGARNPLEAYVYSRRVKGLPKGMYHYSASEHSLGTVPTAELPRPMEVLSLQTWTDGGAAVVFLVANFERTWWKYAHPHAYRAPLIEAGHVGQNVMLAAAHRGLTAAPTALFVDSKIEQILKLDRIKQAVVYALVIGHPGDISEDAKHYEFIG